MNTQFVESKAGTGELYVPAQMLEVEGEFVIISQVKGETGVAAAPDEGGFGAELHKLGYLSNGKVVNIQVKRNTGSSKAHVQVLGVKGNRDYGASLDTSDKSIVAVGRSLEESAAPTPKSRVIVLVINK